MDGFPFTSKKTDGCERESGENGQFQARIHLDKVRFITQAKEKN